MAGCMHAEDGRAAPTPRIGREESVAWSVLVLFGGSKAGDGDVAWHDMSASSPYHTRSHHGTWE